MSVALPWNLSQMNLVSLYLVGQYRCWLDQFQFAVKPEMKHLSGWARKGWTDISCCWGLCEICSRKLLKLWIYKKLFSDLHLPSCLDTPSGWFYSTGFLHWQFLCLLISIVGLSPRKIPSLESLAAFVKTRPKYLIESSSSAQTNSAIYVCRVTSASLAASHWEPEPAQADVPRCQQRWVLSGWVRAFCSHGEPRPQAAGDMGCCKLPSSWRQVLL